MNKKELINAVASKSGLTKKASEQAINALFGQQYGYAGIIVETVASGDAVQIPGFGSFSSLARDARKGRNPQTGAEIDIAATVIPKFKAGSRFKDVLRP